MSRSRRFWLLPRLLLACLGLSACTASRSAYGPAGTLAYPSGQLDTISATCEQRPQDCIAGFGEQAYSLKPEFVAALGTITYAAKKALERSEQEEIQEIVQECVNLADRQINDELLGGKRPTWARCNEEVTMPGSSEKISRARQLGQLKHSRALQCIQQKLDKLLPGRFLLMPRFLYDPVTKKTRLLSLSEENLIRNVVGTMGLRGSLSPDIVIYIGEAGVIEVQAVYDLKFPCPDENRPRWDEYPSDHPYRHRTQEDMYWEATGVKPELVSPNWWSVG